MDLGVFQTMDFDLSKYEEKKDKVTRESMFSSYIFEKKITYSLLLLRIDAHKIISC